MNVGVLGVSIEYLLGIYFLVESLTWDQNRLVADFVRLVAGIILLALAFYGKSLLS
jgi:hypothetical protein